MNETPAPRKIPKARIVLMVVIDVIALIIAVASYLWFAPRDSSAAVIAAVSALVFGAFFNLVIALVSIKP